MLSSSFQSPKTDFNRSSRILGTLSPGEHLEDETVVRSLGNKPLVNNEQTIHQKTAEVSNFEFKNDSDNDEFLGSPDAEIDETLSNSGNFGSTNNLAGLNNGGYNNSSAIDDIPPDLESFSTIIGQNPNAYASTEYFEFNQNLQKSSSSESHSVSKASSIINFTKKINRSVSNKLMNIHKPVITDESTPLLNNYSNSDGEELVKKKWWSEVPTFSHMTAISKELAKESVSLMPCVFLGLLLNILDALSYGMIIFPINKPIFADLGPSGLSMFYISCIVSQLVFSLGGSSFKSAIGSEMIEVTPFFHTMALNIMHQIGTDSNLKNKDSIVATTLLCYVVSTLITGLVFFLLGKFKLGQLIGFFPRHILIGSIGGVGYFLCVTGIEVTSRLTTTFAYNWATFSYLFQGIVFVKWFSSVAITAVLILMQKMSKRLASFSLLLPIYFIFVFAVIHFLIWVVPGWDLQSARDNGFIFDVASSSSSKVDTHESWYHFYSLFKFKEVKWKLILGEIPSMIALTFFGMLHVPINVPALAISVNKENLDLNKELIAHGYSNLISGLCGSIQNYLVYSNSLLFIRSGAGDKRLAGVLLAMTTCVVMFIGPVLIKFIPICVVGSLIFLLGYELLKESLYDSYEKLSTFDYFTIIVIIVSMGLWDFVYGILLGIFIAFISFVIENANQNPIKKKFTGEFVRSTVKRNNLTNTFLRNIGSQTLVMKLQGNIFFGSIGKVEQEIRKSFETSTLNYRYLILDFESVLSVDYTAAEGFQNIKSFSAKSNVFLILSSINSKSIFNSLYNVGLINNEFSGIQIFHDLNSSLEWCENEYLMSIYNLRSSKRKKSVSSQRQKPITLAIPKSNSNDYKYNLTESYLNPMSLINNPNGIESPGQRNIINAITKSVNEHTGYDESSANPKQASSKVAQTSQSTIQQQKKHNESDEILKLITASLGGISNKPATFWKPLLPYLKEVNIAKTSPNLRVVNKNGCYPWLFDEDGESFFIIISGLIQLKFDYSSSQGISETLVPKTAFCSMAKQNYSSALTRYNRNLEIVAIEDTKILQLDTRALNKLAKTDEMFKEIYQELLLVQIHLLSERFDKFTSFVLMNS